MVDRAGGYSRHDNQPSERDRPIVAWLGVAASRAALTFWLSAPSRFPESACRLVVVLEALERSLLSNLLRFNHFGLSHSRRRHLRGAFKGPFARATALRGCKAGT